MHIIPRFKYSSRKLRHFPNPASVVSCDAVDRSPTLGVNNTSIYSRYSLTGRPVSTIPNGPRGVCEFIAAPRSIRTPPGVNLVDICLVFAALKGQRLQTPLNIPGSSPLGLVDESTFRFSRLGKCFRAFWGRWSCKS